MPDDEKTIELLALEKKLEQRRAELSERIRESPDGTVVVELLAPVSLPASDDLHTRVLLRRVKVRDVLAAGRGENLHVLLRDLAPLIAEPAGIVGELELATDYDAVLFGAERALGKYQGGGESSSRLPPTGSTGRGATPST